MPAPEHTLGEEAIHHRWNAALPPALTIRSGDTVHFRCRDSSDGQVTPASTVEDFMRIDRERIHALTGPVFIEEAQPGDVLEIYILDVRHGGWGWSSIVPGLGLLDERFVEPHLLIWKLEEDFSESLAPARVPLRPFPGIMGVAPAADGEFRTRPPGPFGGNMDVRDLTRGRDALPAGDAAGGVVFNRRRSRRAGQWGSVHQRHRDACGGDACDSASGGISGCPRRWRRRPREPLMPSHRRVSG